MNWHLLILGLAPIAISASVMAAAETTPILDYGGLGLAGAVVFFLCKYLAAITKQHREERRELVDSLKNDQQDMKNIIEQDAASRNRLADALGERPCLRGDKRIAANGGG